MTTIDSLWQRFKTTCIPKSVSAQTIDEYKSAFYAGAYTAILALERNANQEIKNAESTSEWKILTEEILTTINKENL